ncbi:hypothetical protein [Micromonospora rubida]|uniref:hypothetical protein n=1 Tax=Micromonospora rubida TaxID=2697657 RepID=UPI001378A88F|nr:hypothetical protein [Micromonospora rubida]NBE82988.1 hypothetical protein [Micromonospora rubida]
MSDKPFYTVADLAVIGARVQDVEEMKGRTISQHLWESQPTVTVTGVTRPGKYAEDPFPTPDDYVGKVPWWAKTREPEIVAWFERHPRRRKGDGIGGRKPKGRAS